MAASPSDVWLTDGLARYSEALYVEQTTSREGMNRALEDYAVGALMYEDAAPIAEARRLVPLSSPYLSIVVNKGAMVFHMLRGRLGDASFFSLLSDFYTQFSGKQASLADFEKMAEQRAAAVTQAPPAPENFAIRVNSAPAGNSDAAPALRPFFAQWLRSTGVPEFTVDYTVFRTTKGFRVVGKIKQALDVFRATVELQVQTEGNPELKTIEVSGTESDFEIEVFGRPKAGGLLLDPHDYILKSSPRLRVRAMIARGEALAEQSRFYDAIQQYAQALDVQKNHALAQFRMGEVFFYQKNYQASANSFRGAIDGDIDPADKWVEVWSHIYLGKIFDISGDRTRAVNEYSRAQQSNDDTGGAQEEVKKYIASPYTERPG
jgi:aminopeptidase N